MPTMVSRDLMITNGLILKDITNRDFVMYRMSRAASAHLIEQW